MRTALRKVSGGLGLAAGIAACVGDAPSAVDRDDDAREDAGGGATLDDSGAGHVAPVDDGGGDAESGPADGGLDAGPPEPPTAISPAMDGPYGLALSNNNAFILTESQVARCALTGCATTTRVARELAPSSRTPMPSYPIDVDENTVFWFSPLQGESSTFIFRCPAAGCPDQNTPVKMPGYTSSLFIPWAVQIGGDGRIRWSEQGLIQECLLDGTSCDYVRCSGGDRMRGFTVVGTTVVWGETTDPAGMYTCQTNDMNSQTPLDATGAFVVTTLGTVAYGMGSSEIYQCETAGCGGEGERIVRDEPGLTSMAVSSEGVFWTASGATASEGVVKMCPLTGCDGAPRIIAENQAGPTSIRLKPGKVFWVNRGSGHLMRAGI